jgi:predicted amidohydrolase
MAIWADDPRLIALARACGQMTAVVGFVEEGRGGNFYNAIAWLQNGEIVNIYRKINLPTYGRLDEAKFFTAGAVTEIVDMDRHWICGGLICADAWDPGLLYLTAMRKATVLALPIASTREAVGGGFSNSDGWALVTQYAAMTYGLPILRCNWTGTHLDMQFWGGSAIYDPSGRVLAAASDGAEMIVAEVTYADLVSARQTLPTTRTLSPEVLRRDLSTILEP